MEKLNLFDIPRFYHLVKVDVERFAHHTGTYCSAWHVYGVLSSADGELDFHHRFPEAEKAIGEICTREGEVTRAMYAMFIEEEYVDDVLKHVEELCNTHKPLLD